MRVVGCGLWRSSDQGKSWQRVDAQTISGRDETGWATTVDANAPERMASFSLDGTAGWTLDGRTWRRFTSLGRNWDFGSVDWSAAVPLTIIAAKHETSPPGEVYLTTDGGVKIGPYLYFFRISIASARSSGVKSIRSSIVTPCRSNAGGFVGNGCVGDAFSPGTVDGAVGRSSIGHTGSPVARSRT